MPIAMNKLTTCLLALQILFFLSPNNVLAAEQSYITDGGFETGLAGFHTPYNDATVNWSSDNPISGNHSMQAQLSSWGNVVNDVYFEWDEGPFANALTATADIRVDSISVDAQVAICIMIYYQDNGQAVQRCSNVVTNNIEAQTTSIFAPIDENRRLSHLYYQILLPAVGVADITVDNVDMTLLVEGEPPVDEPPVDEPPIDEPPVDEPPTEEPPVDEPPESPNNPDINPLTYPDSPLTPSEAARFLTQASYGPTYDSISALMRLGSFDSWIQNQIGLPTNLQLPYFQNRYLAERRAQNRPEDEIQLYFNVNADSGARHDVWWQNAITAEDQLRQRVALALSEILVVSDVDLSLRVAQFGMADYYDTLARNAFGNYRELLEAVTLHPVMGKFLSSIRNEKNNPETNTRPDENFARELLQLFSLGVHQLNADGTTKKDANGNPLPTYTQTEIIEYAKVFTGWNYANISWEYWDGYGNVVDPMVPFEEYHEPGVKNLIDGTSTAGDTRADLEAALDSIFNHPNVGPFLARQLIQRLVTSNPTPGYISRVVTVFNNNGQGVRGDLGATVRAVLLDEEARNGHVLYPETFGKLREPLLRITHTWRAFHANQTPGANYGLLPDEQSYKTPFDGGIYNMERIIDQAPLRAPSVFNFFLPDYSPPGVMRDAGLDGPEFQLFTESATLGIVNLVNSHIQENWREQNQWTSVDLSLEESLAQNTDALLDHLNIVLLSGAMSQPMRTLLTDYFAVSDANQVSDLDKARDIISLIVNSPEYLVQK